MGELRLQLFQGGVCHVIDNGVTQGLRHFEFSRLTQHRSDHVKDGIRPGQRIFVAEMKRLARQCEVIQSSYGPYGQIPATATTATAAFASSPQSAHPPSSFLARFPFFNPCVPAPVPAGTPKPGAAAADEAAPAGTGGLN